MRRILAIAVLAAFITGPALAGWVKTYRSEEYAEKVCRSPVVWINLKSSIYHMKGTRGFGTTAAGAWACQAAADKAGARPAMNGQ